MIDRINLILRAKNITAKQFAEEIGIQPSGMSHILGGRNNPSLDFVTKVIRRYPEIDANWLLFGRGEMYGGGGTASPVSSDVPPAVVPAAPAQPSLGASLFPELEEEVPESAPVQNSGVEHQLSTPVAAEPSEYVPTYMAVPPDSTSMNDEPEDAGRHMVRLLFIYDDGTFEECLPAKRQ